MKKQNILIIFAILSGGVLLISNLAATKIWDFCNIPVDGGILLFPISYILGDLIMEIYGEKTSKTIVAASFMINIMAALVFLVVEKLPAYEGWENQESFEAILGFVPRVVLGSLLAYVASSLVNIKCFSLIKNSTKEEELEDKFYVRALMSSFIAHIVDTLVFETVAFYGVLDFKSFVWQTMFAYTASVILEMILYCLVTRWLVKRIRKIVS